MKKTIIALSVVALFFVLGAESASASTITRSFNALSPQAGSSLVVSLAVDVVPPDTFYIIDEIIPAGWTISSAGTGDTTQAGHIKWAVLSGAASTQLQYTLSVPAAASGVSNFSGEFAFDSNPAPLSILGQTSVNVQPVQAVPILTSVTLTPAAAAIAPAATQQLTAAVKDQLGADFVGATIAWTSNNNVVATVDAAGLVTAVASGNAIITATAQSGAITVTGTANITVSVPGAISQVTRSFDNAIPANCSPLVVSLAVDVVPPDTFYIIDEIIPAGWTISSAGTGDTTQAGHIKWAVLSGAASTQLQYTAVVPCTASGAAVFSGEFAFDSNPLPVAVLGQTSVTVQGGQVLTSITVSPTALSLTVGSTQQLTGQGIDQFGSNMAITPAWTSSNPSIAMVSASGLVTAVSPGTAAIVAASGQISGNIQVQVQAAAASAALNLTAVNQWIIFSAPKKLTAINITAVDIDALLKFDAATQQFVQVVNAADPDLLNPLNAFFVKPNKQTAISFAFSQPAAPETITKGLSQGWNLLSTNNTGLAKDEFSSIQVVTADNTGIGLTTFFAPQSANGGKNLFSDWGQNGDRDLNGYPITELPAVNVSAYDGYWVNMRGSLIFSKIQQ